MNLLWSLGSWNSLKTKKRSIRAMLPSWYQVRCWTSTWLSLWWKISLRFKSTLDRRPKTGPKSRITKTCETLVSEFCSEKKNKRSSNHMRTSKIQTRAASLSLITLESHSSLKLKAMISMSAESRKLRVSLREGLLHKLRRKSRNRGHWMKCKKSWRNLRKSKMTLEWTSSRWLLFDRSRRGRRKETLFKKPHYLMLRA